MERLTNTGRNAILATMLSAVALTGCTIDSYSTDPSAVKCDGTRTEVNLPANGSATFIVHGKHAGDVANLKVKRSEEGASILVSGDATEPPSKRLSTKVFNTSTSIVDGIEFSAKGAGVTWLVDVLKSKAVIEGSCDGA